MSTTTGSEASRRRSLVPAFRHRLQPILTSGLTPKRLAATCSLGIAIGTMPLLLGTTLLCLVIAARFRLNQLLLQTVNYLVYPLQLSLLVPFYTLGNHWFTWGTPIPDHLLANPLTHSNDISVGLAGSLTLKAVAAWLVTVSPTSVFLYLLLLPVLTHLKKLPPPSTTTDVTQDSVERNHVDTPVHYPHSM